MGPDAYKPVKHNIHKSKHNINTCRQRAAKLRGGSQAMVPRWNIIVQKAAVVSAWQTSPFCHILVAGPSCLTEPSVHRIVDPQGRTVLRGAMRVSAPELQRNKTKLRTK